MTAPITVYGDVDERAVSQLRRCADAGDALRGALCADGHVGYSQPIGGAVAYVDHISPSGVGYDIACLAAGTPVTSIDGYWRPIEAVKGDDNVLGWDTARLRVVTPCDGAVPRGVRSLRHVTLALGRELRLTGDHRVRTRLGWKRADELRPGDAVACAPFVGLPHEPAELPAALLRLLAYCAGDGHLAINGKTLAWYTNSREDVLDLAVDLASLGFAGTVSERRDRGQFVLTKNSVELHARFAALGCPVGKKVYAWPERPFEWLFGLSGWQRAAFLSAFMSAEGTTPALAPASGYIAALAVKQSGVTDAAIRFVQRLFSSLGLKVNVTPSGPASDDGRQSYLAQLQGGEAEILRYLREVGFNRCVAKRRAGAAMLSIAAQREAALGMRTTAINDALHLRAVGVGAVREIKATLSAR